MIKVTSNIRNIVRATIANNTNTSNGDVSNTDSNDAINDGRHHNDDSSEEEQS